MAIKKIPCGGFYYDDETIEFDGKVISAKGGGGSELKNAIETGGMGWTEQGDETVITWDGDTTGRDVLTIINSEEPDDVIRMYKVAEYSSKPFTENCELFAAGSQVNAGLYTYDHVEVYDEGAPLAIRTDGTDIDIQGVGMVHAESSGVYFLEMNGIYVESLTYGTPGTVHQIDEKYISKSELVINVSKDENEEWVMDKTANEIKNAITNNVKIKCLVHDGRYTTYHCLMTSVENDK